MMDHSFTASQNYLKEEKWKRMKNAMGFLIDRTFPSRKYHARFWLRESVQDEDVEAHRWPRRGRRLLGSATHVLQHLLPHVAQLM